MTIIKEINSAIVLKKDDRELLGLKTGLTIKGTTRSEFSDIRYDKGYILRESGIEEFHLKEIAEIDGKIYIYSEEISWGLKPFFNSEKSIDSVIELATVLKILADNKIDIENFSTNLFYKNEKDETFIFPPRLINFLNSRSSLKLQEERVSKYVHPDLSGERSLLFSLGILLFEFFTSSYPINYNSPEDLRDKFRRKRFITPRWKNILLSDSLDRLIINLLDVEFEGSLSGTISELIKIKSEGLYRDVENREKLENKNIKLESRFIKKDNFRHSIIKNKTAIIVSIVVLGILTSFFGSIIANKLRPPLTTGYSAEQVVNSYFESFNTIHIELLEDVLAEDVRDEDIKEITSMHVTTAYRGKISGGNTFLRPDEWLLLNDEDKNSTDIFAMDKIEIIKVNELEYSVTYEKWFSLPAETESIEDFKMDTYKVSYNEIFTLEQSEHSYEIVKIETLSREEVKVW